MKHTNKDRGACTRQVLPIPKPGYPINEGEYAALSRAFRKWKKVKGCEYTLPVDAYARWCEQVGVPYDQPKHLYINGLGRFEPSVCVPWHI